MVHSIYNTSPETLNPHRLAYFLIVLAIGVCVDQRRSHQSWVTDAERYHQLARAALCETSVITDPSMDAINALVRATSRNTTTWRLMLAAVLHVPIFVHVFDGQGGVGIRLGHSGAPYKSLVCHA